MKPSAIYEYARKIAEAVFCNYNSIPHGPPNARDARIDAIIASVEPPVEQHHAAAERALVLEEVLAAAEHVVEHGTKYIEYSMPGLRAAIAGVKGKS